MKILLIISLILINLNSNNGQMNPDYPTDCEGFGHIVYVGDYYTPKRDTNNYMTIGINTTGKCADARLMLYQDYDDTNPEMIDPFLVEEINGNTYTDGQVPYYIIYTHFYKLPNLQETETYQYRLEKMGLNTNLAEHTFTVPSPNKDKQNKPDYLIVHGDYDANIREETEPTRENGCWGEYTHQYMMNLEQNEPFDIDYILFLGDYAYNINSEEYMRGQNFFKKTSPYYGSYPNIIAFGNHESGSELENREFKFAKHYFYLPDRELSDDFWYSMDLVYAVMINFDAYNLYYGYTDKFAASLANLENQLIQGQKRQKDLDKPFLIVFTHYPIYDCEEECVKDDNKHDLKQVEELLLKYKVDLYLCAHVHNYQRSIPITYFKPGKWTSDSKEQRNNQFINPDSPVYVLDGQAGQAYYQPVENYPETDLMAKQISNIAGIGRLRIDETQLTYQHVNTKTKEVMDEFTIIKQKEIGSSNNTGLIVGIVFGALALIAIILVPLYLIYRKKQNKNNQNSFVERSIKNSQIGKKLVNDDDEDEGYEIESNTSN